MDTPPDLARAARAIGSPARAAMLWALLGGRALSATELAARAAVSAQTASFHLAALLDAGMVRVERQGRHRYYALAGGETAGALEALEALGAAALPSPVRSVRQSDAARRMRRAGTCYDHLAGRLGVALVEALERRGALVRGPRGFLLTPAGRRRLVAIGVEVAAAERARRKFAPYCLDWSERTPHVAGALGAALCRCALDRGWVAREAVGRSITVTPAGALALCDEMGIRSSWDVAAPAGART